MYFCAGQLLSLHFSVLLFDMREMMYFNVTYVHNVV